MNSYTEKNFEKDCDKAKEYLELFNYALSIAGDQRCSFILNKNHGRVIIKCDIEISCDIRFQYVAGSPDDKIEIYAAGDVYNAKGDISEVPHPPDENHKYCAKNFIASLYHELGHLILHRVKGDPIPSSEDHLEVLKNEKAAWVEGEKLIRESGFSFQDDFWDVFYIRKAVRLKSYWDNTKKSVE